MKKLILLCIFLTACAHSWGTGKIDKPVRTLKVAVIYDSGFTEEAIVEVIRQASAKIEKTGVGINLAVHDPISNEFPRDVRKAIMGMHILYKDRQDIDVVIAAVSYNAVDYTALVLFQLVQLGYMDNVFRRYIVLKKLSGSVIKDELLHGFCFSTTHYCNREEILSNKWRNFSEKPTIRGNQ